MNKYVFFDIDGTIWDDDMVIPDSTKLAINKLHENGHKAILCTGRARASIISDELLNMGFDGIIAACGTYIEMDGKVIFEYTLEQDMVIKVLDVLKKNQMPVVLEGAADYWIDGWGFEEDPYVDYLYADLKEHAHTIDGYDKRMRINKFSADILKDTNYADIKKELSKDFQILEHVQNIVEFIPKNYCKKTGIEWMCTHLGINIEDTYAVGDSVNDIEMLEAVGHSVAMGNATDIAKSAAEYVTTDIHDDGILRALQHYNLI